MSAKCGGLSYWQLGDYEDFGILLTRFRTKQHICKAALSIIGESRISDPKTVSLLTVKVCKYLSHRKRPIYVMKPWLGYTAYPGGVLIQLTFSVI